MKKYKMTIIIVFFLVLLLPIVFTNVKKDQKSKIDNQILPELESIYNTSTLETYLEKRIGFRSEIINAYTLMNDRIFNKMVHPTYDYGTNNYVYFKFVTEELDTGYIDSYLRLVKNMQDYVTSRGSYFLYVLNPTKKTVYEKNLPNGYVYNDINLKYLNKKLKELNINYINNTEFLIEKSKEVNVFNKKYDAGHWNDYGAFYGIENIFNKLEKDDFIEDKIKIEDYNISSYIEKSLPVSKFPIYEEVPIINLKETNYDTVDINENILQNNSYQDSRQTISNANNKRVLMFKGSYFSSKEKFFSPYFGEVYYFHNYGNAINFDYFYNLSNHPDIVIFTGVEYTISDTFFKKQDILNKEYNPLYSSLNFDEYNLVNLYDLNDFENIKSISYSNNKLFTNIVFETQNIDYIYLISNDKVYDFSKEKNSLEKFTLSLEQDILENNEATLVFIDNNNKLAYFSSVENLKSI